jgi:hypothetical protein
MPHIYVLSHVIRTVSPTSLKQMANILVEEWDKISLETIHSSFTNLFRGGYVAVLKANGGPTRY